MQLNAIMTKKQKWLFLGVFVLTWIGAFFETLGISAILPFVQMLLAPERIMSNKYIKCIADVLNLNTAEHLMILLGVGVIFIYIVKNVFLVFSNYESTRYQMKVQKELSCYMLEQYMRRPYIYFANNNSSEIIRNIDSDISSIAALLQNGMKVLTETLTATLICIIILITDIWLAIGIIAIAIVCICGILLGGRGIIKRNGIKQRDYGAKKWKSLFELLSGMKEIQVMNRRKWFAENYEVNLSGMCHTNVIQNVMGILPEKIIEASCVTGLIGMICVRISMGVSPTEFVAKLAVFAVAAFRILPSISRIISGVNMVLFYKPALRNTYENLQEIKEYNNKMKELLESGKVDDSAIQIQFEKEICVNDVFWKYPNTNKFILNGLNLSIKKGESIALIGESGSGKTTLSDVILGLLRPQKGTICIDNIDIATIPVNWSRLVGFVPQAVFLTDDTVRNNIAFGIPEEEIDDEKIWNALEQAQLKKYIETLPGKIDTIVGERGIKFSGGQKQRVAIARALYNRPEILILDEATAALDMETETAVMESIDALQGQITMVIVAHRITTIRNCDKIYEIKNGIATEKKKELILNKINQTN